MNTLNAGYGLTAEPGFNYFSPPKIALDLDFRYTSLEISTLRCLSLHLGPERSWRQRRLDMKARWTSGILGAALLAVRRSSGLQTLAMDLTETP